MINAKFVAEEIVKANELNTLKEDIEKEDIDLL